jgi:hypothetical protein
MEELLGAVFTVRSVQRPYSEGQLPLEESLDMAVGVKWLPACEDESPEAGKRPLVKTQQTEKT